MTDGESTRLTLARLLGEAENVTVFTGAGISTECGVPDYRSPGSPWRVNEPIGFKDFLADPARRAEAWRRKFAMDDLYAGALPGRGHRAVARWAERGLAGAVIPQNIDGLHQAAGLAPTIPLDGSISSSPETTPQPEPNRSPAFNYRKRVLEDALR